MDLVLEGMVAFSLPEVEGLDRESKGLPPDLAIEVWRGFVRAMEANLTDPHATKLTDRQKEMAMRASFLLGACAKNVGAVARINGVSARTLSDARHRLQPKQIKARKS